MRVAEIKPRLQKQMRERYLKKREQILAYVKQWGQENPEKVKATKQSYKHRRRSSEKAGISGGVLLGWKNSQAKVCYWCGVACEQTYAVDHYYPLSKGGKHEISNLVIACRPCNAKKAARDPVEFLNTVHQVARTTVIPEMLEEA